MTFIALLSVSQPAFTQCQYDDCDPALTGAGIAIGCLDIGGYAEMVLDWGMLSRDFVDCTAPPGSFVLQVSLPASRYYISDGVPADVIQPSMFDWTYNSPDNTWTGLNNVDVHLGQGGTVKIRVKGNISTDCVPIYFTPQFLIMPSIGGGCPAAFQDRTFNNWLDPAKGVAEPLAITLSDFIAKPDCKSVQISFIVSNPVNNHYMEVQRSVDGRHFTTINKIVGDNEHESLKYKIADFQVNEGTTYYYRLRQVDFDGTETFFDPIVVRTPICDGEKTLTIYPNPVMNRLYLDVTGFESGEKGNIIIRNSIGETVQVFKDVVINDFKEVDVLNYVSGSYTIQLESAGSQFVQKFIKIE